MLFLLDAHNVVDYLLQAGVCNTTDLISNQIQLRDSKNFNLQVDFANGSSLLVKQSVVSAMITSRVDSCMKWCCTSCFKLSQTSLSFAL